MTENLGFDDLGLVVEEAHRNNIKAYVYMTIFDEGWPLTTDRERYKYIGSQSIFTINHPEFLVTDRLGIKQYGVLEYAYPEARQYSLDLIRTTIADYPFDGLFICTRSQSKPALFGDQFGFNKPVVEEYERRYGANILERDFDLGKWRRLRGGYLTQLLREIRDYTCSKALQLAMGVPRGDYMGPPLGNLYIDWRTWFNSFLLSSS